MEFVHENVKRIVFKSLGENPTCGICMDTVSIANVSVLECSHVTCKDCLVKLYKDECPFCKNVIRKRLTRKDGNKRINELHKKINDLESEVTFYKEINQELRNELDEMYEKDGECDGSRDCVCDDCLLDREVAVSIVRRRLCFDRCGRCKQIGHRRTNRNCPMFQL